MTAFPPLVRDSKIADGFQLYSLHASPLGSVAARSPAGMPSWLLLDLLLDLPLGLRLGPLP